MRSTPPEGTSAPAQATDRDRHAPGAAPPRAAADPSRGDVHDLRRPLGIDETAAELVRVAAPLLLMRIEAIDDELRRRCDADAEVREALSRGTAEGSLQRLLRDYVSQLVGARLDADHVAGRRAAAEDLHRYGLPLAVHRAMLDVIREHWTTAIAEDTASGRTFSERSAVIRAIDRQLIFDDGVVAGRFVGAVDHRDADSEGVRIVRDTSAVVFERLGDLDATMDALVDGVRKALGADRATCYVHDDAATAIDAVYTTERDPELREHVLGMRGRPRDKMPIWDHIVRSAEPVVVVEDMEEDSPHGSMAGRAGVGAFLGVRLERTRSADDADDAQPMRLGTIFASWEHARAFTAEDRLNALNLAALGALALANARLQKDRLQLEVELRQSHKLEAIGQLAAGVAHEINTPIQFVGDSVYFLRQAFDDLAGLVARYHALAEAAATGPVDPALVAGVAEEERIIDIDDLLGQIPRALERTSTGAERVAEIVRAMKEFAHPAQEEQGVADLNHAILSTLVVARNEIKYVADVDTDLGPIPPVVCHVGDLNQVVLNLVVNAAHAIADRIAQAAPGSPQAARGRIGVTTSEEDGWVTISVSDDGTGIPEEARGRIFDPFFTTKEVGRGSGQGLAISRSIVVDKHGGTLTFDTRLDAGTTFTARIPVGGFQAATTPGGGR